MLRLFAALMIVGLFLAPLPPSHLSAQMDSMDGPGQSALLTLLDSSPVEIALKGCDGLCVDLSDPNCSGGPYSCCLDDQPPPEPNCSGVIFWIYCDFCEGQQEQPTLDGSVALNIEPALRKSMASLVEEASAAGTEVFRSACSGAVTSRWYSESKAKELRLASAAIEF